MIRFLYCGNNGSNICRRFIFTWDSFDKNELGSTNVISEIGQCSKQCSEQIEQIKLVKLELGFVCFDFVLLVFRICYWAWGVCLSKQIKDDAIHICMHKCVHDYGSNRKRYLSDSSIYLSYLDMLSLNNTVWVTVIDVVYCITIVGTKFLISRNAS